MQGIIEDKQWNPAKRSSCRFSFVSSAFRAKAAYGPGAVGSHSAYVSHAPFYDKPEAAEKPAAPRTITPDSHVLVRRIFLENFPHEPGAQARSAPVVIDEKGPEMGRDAVVAWSVLNQREPILTRFQLRFARFQRMNHFL